MENGQSLYDSARLAEGYAHHRPPVHQAIVKKIIEGLCLSGKLKRALDVGCGAGLSTAAIEPLAEQVIGIEPVPAMLQYRKAVTVTAGFLAAEAERLPFPPQSFELITAAGAINYADRDLFFPEVERVLALDGTLVIYDFSAGRRFQDDDSLDEWFDAFEQRYPSPPGYHFDVRRPAYDRYGLQLASYEEFVIALPMTRDAYLSYALSETSVEQAILNGTPEREIRSWCDRTLKNLFDGVSRYVLFDGYLAYVTRDGRPKK